MTGDLLNLWRDGAALAGTTVLIFKAPEIGEVDSGDPVDSPSAAVAMGIATLAIGERRAPVRLYAIYATLCVHGARHAV